MEFLSTFLQESVPFKPTGKVRQLRSFAHQKSPVVGTSITAFFGKESFQACHTYPLGGCSTPPQSSLHFSCFKRWCNGATKGLFHGKPGSDQINRGLLGTTWKMLVNCGFFYEGVVGTWSNTMGSTFTKLWLFDVKLDERTPRCFRRTAMKCWISSEKQQSHQNDTNQVTSHILFVAKKTYNCRLQLLTDFSN